MADKFVSRVRESAFVFAYDIFKGGQWVVEEDWVPAWQNKKEDWVVVGILHKGTDEIRLAYGWDEAAAGRQMMKFSRTNKYKELHVRQCRLIHTPPEAKDGPTTPARV